MYDTRSYPQFPKSEISCNEQHFREIKSLTVIESEFHYSLQFDQFYILYEFSFACDTIIYLQLHADILLRETKVSAARLYRMRS